MKTTIVIFTVTMLLMLWLMQGIDALESEIIEKGHAYRHPETGVFIWKGSE